MSQAAYKPGDLQVWWIPQVPGDMFTVAVDSVEMAVKIMDTLAAYDQFQLAHNIKPDYSNAGGLRRWCADSDGAGTPGWEDWYDDATGEDNPAAYVMDKQAAATGKQGEEQCWSLSSR